MKAISEFFDRFIQSKAGRLIYPLLAPLLFGLYPSLYFYTKNATMVMIASYWRVLSVYLLLILVVYLVSLVIHKFNGLKAANAAAAFLLFFNFYGMLFTELSNANLFRVEHLTMLPLFLFLAGYSVWFLNRIKAKKAASIWRWVTLVSAVLIAITILKLIPIEVKKAQTQRAAAREQIGTVNAAAGNSPDIYYLVFDEFSGLEAMREYFNSTEVDGFKAFLEGKGFFVGEKVFGSSNHTVHQMAVRMNYNEYPYVQGDQPIWHEALANARGIAYLDAKGYTTMVFEEISMLHPTLPKIKADYLYRYNYNSGEDLGTLFDEYGMLVADTTMAYAFERLYKVGNPDDLMHHDFLFFTKERLPNLEDIPGPHFVYAHLMIPHQPFMFDRNGALVDSAFFRNWNYYEGQYIYTMKYIEELVTDILKNADPDNPPVIILQSDHGARIHEDNKELSGFPQDMLRNILFALYLPGYDTSTIAQDENPINTLPIVFNHYFGDNIPLMEPNLPGVDND
ncbi:MAG TPA: hypothetical protein PK883_05250 [Anaerolineaceae bacterium]|nr:hypothetical protein [Anaerolineaceae bacterium]